VGKIDLPSPTHSRKPVGRLKPWVTVRERIGELPEQPTGTSLPETRVEYFGQELPGPFKSPDLHIGRNPRDQSLLRYDCIPPGGGRFDLPDELLPDCWRNKPTGTTDVMGRMRWDAPSLTIRTEFFKPEKGQYLHPQWDSANPSRRVNRVITHYEAALLQDFPETYSWCGSKIEIAKQIGNAVPPPLARAIAGAVIDALGVDPSRPEQPVNLGDPTLLYLEMSEAAERFGVPAPSSKRDRKSGAKKRKQHEIEEIRLKLVANGR
jgi:DNA (cytosine-5)-methyltransferase 1